MSWILPGTELIERLEPVNVREVCRASPLERRMKKKDVGDKYKKWRAGARGTLWNAKNKRRRNEYHRKYYAANPARRAYLSAKRKEYRARDAGKVG